MWPTSQPGTGWWWGRPAWPGRVPSPQGTQRVAPHRLPHPDTQSSRRYLLSIELVELGLGAVSAPQAQHLAQSSSHVDEFRTTSAHSVPTVTAQHHKAGCHTPAGAGGPGLPVSRRPAPGRRHKQALEHPPGQVHPHLSIWGDADPERLGTLSSQRAAAKRRLLRRSSRGLKEARATSGMIASSRCGGKAEAISAYLSVLGIL